MSKISCLCGHTIVDQTDDLPYKAAFIADQDQTTCFGLFFQFVADLLEAREQGRQNDFLEQQFGADYPRDLELRSILNDAFTFNAFSHKMYECEVCGRLWIQTKPQENIFVSYLPETEVRGILRSTRKTTDG